MLDIAYELVGQATSNSLLMFCFCNLIIVIILTGSSKPGSMDSQDYNTFTSSVSFNNLASEDHDCCGDDHDHEEMIVIDTMMDPDMFAEDPSFNEKFDIDFEFDAPRFYDFSKPELDSETELWFESAGNYPPSPFSLNLSCIFDDKHLKIPKPVSDKYNGFIYYNQTANYLPKSTQKSKNKPFLRKNSTLTRPTASLLARQNKPLDIYSVQLLTRCQRSLGKLEGKISSSVILSMPQTQDTKRQKLESGFLRKISRLEQTPFVHKVPKKRFQLRTSLRAKERSSSVSRKFGETTEIKHENNFPRAVMSRSSRMASLQLLTLLFFFFFTVSKSIDVSKPHAAESFDINLIQNFGSCRYTVIIRTSCSSPRYTRDQISLSFGDGYRNQVYAPRLDDPGSRAFERCSSDTYEINGPCVRQICYVYVHRSGPDGWVPESVQIFSHSSKAVTFTFNTHVPESIWFGHNYCNTI
uniref:PLAT domain-containing protein n=1 Tax=Brassica campestris TaxID=3711 RepID=M4CNY8_BRACM